MRLFGGGLHHTGLRDGFPDMQWKTLPGEADQAELAAEPINSLKRRSRCSVRVARVGARLGVRSLSELGVPLLTAAFLAGSLAVASVSAQTVRGQVLDDSTGTGLAGTRVNLLQQDGDVVQRGLTGQDGAFRLEAPRGGLYRVRARRLGYAPRTTPLLDLRASDTLVVGLRLTTAAVTLAPVTVVGRRGNLTVFDPHLQAEGYYDRETRYGREGLGSGIFLDGDKLRPTASQVADLLGDVPGLRVRAAGGTKQVIDGRLCPPNVFVDGTFVGRGNTDQAEEAMPPAVAVAAIEVYPGIVAPVRYIRFGSEGCGVVLIWTGVRH